jgi:hypothetical protein
MLECQLVLVESFVVFPVECWLEQSLQMMLVYQLTLGEVLLLVALLLVQQEVYQ